MVDETGSGILRAMNLNDYETKYFWIYKDLAKTVRFILEEAFRAAKDLPVLNFSAALKGSIACCGV